MSLKSRSFELHIFVVCLSQKAEKSEPIIIFSTFWLCFFLSFKKCLHFKIGLATTRPNLKITFQNFDLTIWLKLSLKKLLNYLTLVDLQLLLNVGSEILKSNVALV